MGKQAVNVLVENSSRGSNSSAYEQQRREVSAYLNGVLRRSVGKADHTLSSAMTELTDFLTRSAHVSS
jgi:hypothetical protein